MTDNSTASAYTYNRCATESGTLAAGAEKYYACNPSNGHGGYLVDGSGDFLVPGKFMYINIIASDPLHVREVAVHGYALSVL